MLKKKSRIIVWSIVGAMVLVLTIAVLRADRMVENVAGQRLTQLAAEQHMDISWHDIHIHLLQGKAQIDSLSVGLCVADSIKNDTTFIHVSVPRLSIGSVNWLALLRERIALIDAVRVTNGHVALSKSADSTMLTLDSICVAVHDLCYNLTDSLLTYNDSVYSLQTGRFHFRSADGLFAATVGRILTADAGMIVLSNISGGNTDKPEEHGRLMGKQEVTWSRFRIPSVRTSPVNIIRMVKANEVRIDSVIVEGQSTDVYYDSKYPPKQPYPMPQQALLELKTPLHIRRMIATLDTTRLYVTSDGKNVGRLDLLQTRARIINLCNIRDRTMMTSLHSHFAGGGEMRVKTDMKLNKRGTFTYNADITELTGSSLKSLSQPMLGVELHCNIHNMSVQCAGNNTKMNGTFCMQYDSLSVHVNEHSPMEVMARLSGLVNAFAPVVLINQNPRNPNDEPMSYEVSATRDPMKPFPAYFLGVIADGTLQTVLPFGLGKGALEKKKKVKK